MVSAPRDHCRKWCVVVDKNKKMMMVLDRGATRTDGSCWSISRHFSLVLVPWVLRTSMHTCLAQLSVMVHHASVRGLFSFPPSRSLTRSLQHRRRCNYSSLDIYIHRSISFGCSPNIFASQLNFLNFLDLPITSDFPMHFLADDHDCH